ncbi:MAG: PKD domain-containing protein [Chloroflexi bacterium]|nr:PKD domain-containing protein [Chloroflexota bacterium]
MNPWRRRPDGPARAGGPQEPISLEDIAWRIGASAVRPPHYDEEEAAALAAAATVGIGGASVATPVVAARDATPAGGSNPAPGGGVSGAAGQSVLQPRPLERPAHTVRRTVRASTGFVDHARPGGGRRRAILWRDMSALLFAVVAIALIIQLAQPRNGQVAGGIATPRASAAATDVAISSAGAGDSPLPTIGGVIDPNLIPIINATPTPVPTPTLAPGATPRPTPRPTPRGPQPTPYVLPTTPPQPTPTPTPGPGPTPLPTPTPTPPTPTPTPTSIPTDTPPPVTSVDVLSCSPPADVAPYTVTCTATGTNVDTWSWFLDGVPLSETTSSASVPITTPGQYTIKVTGTGAGGSDFKTYDTTAS